MRDKIVTLQVNVKCPRDLYCVRQVPLKYIPMEGDVNYAATAGCDFLSGSPYCQKCINRLLEIFTTKRDYEGETIYMHDINND